MQDLPAKVAVVVAFARQRHADGRTFCVVTAVGPAAAAVALAGPVNDVASGNAAAEAARQLTPPGRQLADRVVVVS